MTSHWETKNPCGEIPLTFTCSKCKDQKNISESSCDDSKDFFKIPHMCKPCKREETIDNILK